MHAHFHQEAGVPLPCHVPSSPIPPALPKTYDSGPDGSHQRTPTSLRTPRQVKHSASIEFLSPASAWTHVLGALNSAFTALKRPSSSILGNAEEARAFQAASKLSSKLGAGDLRAPSQFVKKRIRGNACNFGGGRMGRKLGNSRKCVRGYSRR
ncbi:hypothetical protein BD410DRAFT_333853 [Rickenella mellea]|uniref:Uncharacterized protein n=1 Tax=Rickenella mellea TaxID=50990 RepID=A0A4Y7QKR2_9AGAM|nr:hypothetical protein BD410DRAFT_333853 [Rickenella mellea]